MKKLIPTVFLILAALPAFCDGTGTLISWPGWTVSSTENIYMGYKHTSFPLTYLFDGNVATAWVFSGKGKNVDGSASGYAITLMRHQDKKPITIDSIWIMNGYNKSRELFLRNNRITQIKLYINDKFIKNVMLADSMAWHKISIPRQQVRDIKLCFTKLEKGRDNDVCVSELAFYNRGKIVNLKMPRAVEYTEGDGDCGCGQSWHMIDRNGKRLASYDGQSPCVWSPSGRYVAAAPYSEFWVVDASTGKVIMRRAFNGDNYTWTSVDKWKDDHSVVVSVAKSTPKKTGKDEYETDYYTKIIKITNR